MQINHSSGWIGLVIAIACLSHSGCTAVDNAAGLNNANIGESLKQPSGSLTRKELSQKLRRLAMSYLGEVPEACEQIAASNPSLDQRLFALSIRVNSADSVISIAADSDPQISLLNMVTILTLQRMLAEERGEEFFGEMGPVYLKAAQRMEDEVWKIAAQVMDEAEQTELRALINQYRKDNPNEVYVWWVRFSEFTAYREQFSVASIGQSIVDVFVPVGGAVQGIDTTNDVAERATWLAARQALIVQWRIELAYLQTLAAPETTRLLNDVERVSATIDALPDRLANERKEILKSIEDQEAALSKIIAQSKEAITETRGAVTDARATVNEANAVVKEIDGTLKTAGETVGEVNATIRQADESLQNAKSVLPGTESALAQLETTSQSLDQTLQTLDAFVGRFESKKSGGGRPDPAPARPFDITEYTAAAREAGHTAEQLNMLVSNIDQAAEPTRLDASLDTLEGRASALIWQTGFMIVAAGLILILAAKLIPRRQPRTAI